MKTLVAFGEEKSILAWSNDERCKVSRRSLIKRLEAGMDPEAAITKEPSAVGSKNGRAGDTVEAFGETKSVNAWSEDLRCRVSRSMLRKRLASGMSPEEALTNSATRIPNKTLRSAFGESKTLAAHFRDTQCPVTYNQLITRLTAGMDLETALIAPPPEKRLIEAFGETKTMAEWSRDDRCVVPLTTLKGRLSGGWPIDEALTKANFVPTLYEAFGEKKQLGDWVQDVRCVVDSIGTLHSRIHGTGMDVETALVTPASPFYSFAESTLADFVESLGFDIERNCRSVIGPQELDIYIPSLKIGVEFNGLRWHSEKFRRQSYHADKLNACAAVGVRLLQVWEDDWRDRRPIVESMLRHKLGVSSAEKIYARQTTVDVNVSTYEVSHFLNAHHIQGNAGGSVRMGLRSDGVLVALAVFAESADDADWNLVRYATSCNVVGGFSKLLKNFRRLHPGSIKTFADLCWSDGDLYKKTGSFQRSVLAPDYQYVVNDCRVHKFLYRKKKFETDPNLQFAEGLTERELAALNGLQRIYDAGKIKYVLS